MITNRIAEASGSIATLTAASFYVPCGTLGGGLQRSERQRQELGEKVWAYNATSAITDIGKLPRLIGWFCWKYGLDGYLHFAIDYPDSSTIHNPWMSTGSHWTIFFYPTVKTWDEELPIWENSAKWDWSVPSIRLMQIRDGFEDYEYMTMLKDWILLAERHGRNEQNPILIEQARKLLDIQDNFVGNFVCHTDSPEDMIEARKRVGDMIEQLRLELTGEQF